MISSIPLGASEILLAASLIVSVSFCIYGFNIFYLIGQSRRHSSGSNSMVCNDVRPSVSVQLPIYNERYVALRLMDAVVKMTDGYGRDKVQIMVLDDSTDDTTQIVSEHVEILRLRGYSIEMIHRNNRDGFKGGALANALQYTRGDYIVIFDADFVPQEDFLEKTIPQIVADPSIGFLQCRWGHINQEYNVVTKAAALAIDAFFLVEQTGRYEANCFINFNGSAGILRREAIIAAGGWYSDTLSEDLDLSYRMQIKSWKYVYLRDLICPAEIPPTLAAFKRQQSRWAQGSIRTAKRLIHPLLRDGQITLKQKVEGVIHLTYYLVHLLMFTAYILALTATFSRVDVIRLPIGMSEIIGGAPYMVIFLVALYVAIASSTIAVWVMCYIASIEDGMRFITYLQNAAALTVVGYGISINDTIAVFKGLFGARSGTFHRTPKYRIESLNDLWRDKIYQIPVQKTELLELTAGAVAIVALVYALLNSNVGIVPILALYGIAYTTVGSLSIYHGVFGGGMKASDA